MSEEREGVQTGCGRKSARKSPIQKQVCLDSARALLRLRSKRWCPLSVGPEKKNQIGL